jgi:predicted transposase/invertase (TIGR01784 family)
MRAKYVNLFTDFGFKKIFGEEANKNLLVDFLNALLPVTSHIKDLTFKNTEQLGQTDEERKVVYDIYCENEAGEKFIVELQKAKQNFFKERTIYYSTFPIREQGEKGHWNYNLKAVFCIGILDFTFSDYKNEDEKNQVVHEIKLRNPEGKTFYDKLTYIYLEMPNFRKTEAELKTRLDQWLYFINNLEDFQSIPLIFKNEVVFLEAFEKAELAKFNQTEMAAYEANLKPFRDLFAVLETAKEEAEKKGWLEGQLKGQLEGQLKGQLKGEIIGEIKGEIIGEIKGIAKVAKAMKENGISIDLVHKTTGLSEEEINRL